VVEYYGHSAYQVLAHESSTRGVLRRTERQVDMAPTARALLVPRCQQTTHLRSTVAAPVARRRPLLLRADVLFLSGGGLSTIASPEGAPTDRMQERRPAAGVRTAGRPFQVTGGAHSPITPRDDPPLKRFATKTYPHQSKIQKHAPQSSETNLLVKHSCLLWPSATGIVVSICTTPLTPLLTAVSKI